MSDGAQRKGRAPRTPDPEVEAVRPEPEGHGGGASAGEERALATGTGGGLPGMSAGVGATLELQTEILRRLADEQSRLSRKVHDDSRAETMIQSTRALNDTFEGLRRSQERLAERLREPHKRSIWLAAGVLGLLVVGGGLAWMIHGLGQRVEDSARTLAEGDGATELVSGALTSLNRLGERMEALEERDREIVSIELEALRERIEDLDRRRAELALERDRVREELGATRARLETAEGERDDARESLSRNAEALRAAERSGAELASVRDTLAEREAELVELRAAGEKQVALATRLAEMVRALRVDPRTPLDPEVSAALARADATEADGDGTAKPTAAGDAAADAEARVAAGREAGGGEPAAAKPAGVKAPSATLAGEINTCLGTYKGASVYRLTHLGGVGPDRLHDVVVEERDRRNRLLKTFRAEQMEVELAPEGRLLTIRFTRGNLEMTLPQGQPIATPFFRDTYEILLFGMSRETWTGAGFPFLRVQGS